MDLHRHGAYKFPNAGLIATSLGRGRSGVAAEVRSHPAGNRPAIVPTQMEITLAIRRSSGAFVTRKGAGVGEDGISIRPEIPEALPGAYRQRLP